MKSVKRKAAVFGFSLLGSMLIYMISGSKAAFAILAGAALLSAASVLRRARFTYYLLIFFSACLTGCVLLTVYNEAVYRPALALEGEQLEITGTVCDPPSYTGNPCVILKNCTVGQTSCKSRIKLYYRDEYILEPGDRLSFTCSKLYASSDEQSIYFYHSLSDKTWLNANAYCELQIDRSKRKTFTEFLSQFRTNVKKKILMADFPADRTALICALITGDQSFISPECKNIFRRSGTSHILAVSGMHLALWSGVLFFLFMKRTRTRKWGNLIAILFIILYSIFTGLSPSVLRSAVMLIMVYGAAFINKRADPVNSLGLSAVVLLTVNPWLAGNISFLLSFFATFGIVVISPLLTVPKKEDEKIPVRIFRKSGNAVIVSLAVIFAILPFSVFFFGYISVLSPFTGLLCAPAAEGIMLLSGLSLFFPAQSFPFRLFFSAADTLSALLLKITSAFAGFSWSVFSPDENFLKVWFPLTCAALAAAYLIFKNRYKPIAITFLACTLLLVADGLISGAVHADDIHLYVPSSEECLCAAISYNNGKNTILLGTEGSYDSAAGIEKFLLKETADDIDKVILPSVPAKKYDILPELSHYFKLKDLYMTQRPAKDHELDGGVYSDAQTLRLDKDIVFSYESYNKGWGGLLELRDKKIVFLDISESDLSVLPRSLRKGDILLCKGELPSGIDPDGFTKIVLAAENAPEDLSSAILLGDGPYTELF